jgi:hypothetical protein
VSGSDLIFRKSYHDLSMTQGIRIQAVVPPSVAEALKQRAAREQRSLSNLAAYLLEQSARSEHGSCAGAKVLSQGIA